MSIDTAEVVLFVLPTKGTRRTFKPPLQPIPVGGPYHQVAVDLHKFPVTSNGNCYIVIFMDYLTKWPEAFAIPDQKAETTSLLFLEHNVCRHGIPEELLTGHKPLLHADPGDVSDLGCEVD